MKLIVNPHKIEIEKTPVNEKEINVTTVEFEFTEEITNDYVKEAYFTINGNSYKKIVVNNQCNIPGEVLQEKGQVEIGVVAYLVEDENEIKRYNPSPVFISTLSGSLKDAENTEPITPSEMEQFEQALQDGLNAIGEAITSASTLDIDASKTGNVATVTITKQDGTTKEVEINDGLPGTPGRDGRDGSDGQPGPANTLSIGTVESGEDASATITGTSPNQTLNLVLPKGDKGDTGNTGSTGPAGRDGSDGVSPIITTSKSGKITTLTIVDAEGTKTSTILDGNDGSNGTNGSDGVGLQYNWNGTQLGVKREDEQNYSYTNLKGEAGTTGADGYSPSASVTKSGSTATISITDKNGTTTASVSDGTNGTNGQDGYTPIKGVDYFTAEDIASLNIPRKTSDLINDDITKNVIQIKKGPGTQTSYPSGYTLIKLETIGYSKGTLLTENDGKIIIGRGISKIKVSSSCDIYDNSGSTGIEIRKNDDTRIALFWNYSQTTGKDISSGITDIYADVQEGDVIALYLYRSAARTMYVQDTYLTVQAVE